MTDLNVVPIPEPPVNGDFVETPTARAIGRLVGHCAEHADMGLIVGAPGSGKTTALARFAQTHRDAYLCTMAPSTSSLVQALSAVADVLGTQAFKNGAVEVRAVIVRRIEEFTDNGVLLIDEAQHVNDQALEELRLVYDETGIGLVLAGNATFPTRFNGRRGEANFAQLTSRIGMRLDLDAPLPEDIAAFCDHNRVRGRKARGFLDRQGARAGGLRTVAKLTRLAQAAAGDGKPIEFEHLQAAADLLRGVSHE